MIEAAGVSQLDVSEVSWRCSRCFCGLKHQKIVKTAVEISTCDRDEQNSCFKLKPDVFLTLTEWFHCLNPTEHKRSAETEENKKDSTETNKKTHSV